MRVLVTRARADAERTASRLVDAGHEAVIAPVIEIVGTGAALPQHRPDAVLATSVHALVALANVPPTLVGAQWLVVGERLRQALEERGIATGAVAADVRSLAHTIDALYPRPARFLYLAGCDRKPDLEQHLARRGHVVAVVETYAARAAPALPAAGIAALRGADVQAALHFSRRSAGLLVDLVAAAGLDDCARRLRHIAISSDAATPLRAKDWLVEIAPTSEESSMVRTLGSGVIGASCAIWHAAHPNE